jgi:hypothetical protein
LATEIQAALGVEVRITGSLRRGRIVLSYNSKEQLTGLYDKLTR